MTAEQLSKLCVRGDIRVVFDNADGIDQVAKILDPMYPTVRWASNEVCSDNTDALKRFFERYPKNSIICFIFSKSGFSSSVCITYYSDLLQNETIEHFIKRHNRYLYYEDFLDLLKRNRYIINKEVI